MGISEITLKEATRLCSRADQALHQNVPLSRADLAILRNALETWALIGDELTTGHFSLRRLREIYGLELVTKSNISDPSTTDKTKEDASQTAKSPDEPREPKPRNNPVEGRNKNHPGRRDAKDFPEVPITLHRTCGLDPEICTCGARMRVDDVITDTETITEILVSMGLAATPPPRGRRRETNGELSYLFEE